MSEINNGNRVATPDILTVRDARLLATDFDDTIALTSELGPGVIDVNEAYKRAIHEVFGIKEFDGHQGRTPDEIVADIRGTSDPDKLRSDVEALIAAKLDLLTRQIGEPLADGVGWPRPVDGFLDFWQKFQAAIREGRALTSAALSAGHDEFIKLTFESWGVPSPDILVTSDLMRSNYSHLPMDQTVKPATLILLLAEQQWLHRSGIVVPQHFDGPALRPDHIIYVGDNDERDGGLARNAGVEFAHVGTNPAEAWEKARRWLGIGSVALEGAANE